MMKAAEGGGEGVSAVCTFSLSRSAACVCACGGVGVWGVCVCKVSQVCVRGMNERVK